MERSLNAEKSYGVRNPEMVVESPGPSQAIDAAAIHAPGSEEEGWAGGPNSLFEGRRF
jgi:hypothetical protein